MTMGQDTIFERLSSSADAETFANIFTENLPCIFEYDKEEITDYLSSDVTDRDTHIAKLMGLRLQLLDKLRLTFPDSYTSAEMYNRRKTGPLVEDIYILGNSIVNKMKDRRLSKVLKPRTGSETVSHRQPEDAVIETSDLVETCVLLRDTVTNLSGTIGTLTNEISDLRDKIATLEMKLSRLPMHRNNDETEQQVTSDDIGTIQRPTNPEGNQEQEPHDQNTPPIEIEDSDSTDNEFRLPVSQLRKLRRGQLKVQRTSHNEVVGSAPARRFRIEAAKVNAHSNKPGVIAIYVGHMNENSTETSLKDHLRDIGITSVTGIVNLRCRLQGKTSFCVSLDSQRDEEKMYKPENWPAGVRDRPFKERTTRRSSQGQGSYAPPRLRGPAHMTTSHNDYERRYFYDYNHQRPQYRPLYSGNSRY